MRNPFTILAGKVDRFKEAAKSKETFIEYLEAPHAKGEDADHHNRWSNIDLAQSPPEDRKWTKWTYLAFWIANAAGVGNWTAGASLIALGLYPLDTWLCLATSHLWITLMILLNGRGPSRYHVGFPIMARSAYGMWGSYVILAMRAVVCIVWNGVNSFYGGRLVSVAIGCIWPQWRRLPNTLPADAAITTTQLAGFLIFMLVFISLAFVHSRDLKPLYYFKSVYVSLAMHAVLIWFAVKAGGLSFSGLGSPPPGMSKTQRAWLCLQAFNVGLGTASSLSVNQGDMARYADKPNAQLWTTLIGYPIASALPCLYGILVASATKQMTGTAIWNIWDTLELMLNDNPDNSGNRFFVFLLATAFAIAYVALNLATNSLPFGSDVSALFPRWMTIRRGQVIAALLGVALVPWKILNSARAFITFLSGYGYFLAAIAAVLSTDYFIIKKGNLKLHDLWIGDSSSRFWYYRGVNYRAIFATFAGLVPCLPSFIATLAPNLGISQNGQRMFYISFTLTYFIGGILYYVAYLIFPEKNLAVRERDLKFEQWADELDEAERRSMAAMAAEEGQSEDKDEAAKEVETSQTKVHVLPST